jgi:tetratricopeptide (TPR) repeat protein
MKLRFLIRPVLLSLLIPGLQTCLGAQDMNPTKEMRPPQFSYSSEESSTRTPQLAQKESDLRAALAAQPDSADLLYALGLVLRQEGKPRESLDTYTRAARYRKPASAELRSVAIDYVLLNDYEDAIHWLELAVGTNPTDADTLYALGRCYYSKDRYVDAGRMFARVLELEPKHLKAEENLGLVYDATNCPDKSEEALRAAAGWANPNGTDEWPFLDLGNFLLEQNRAQEAIAPLRIAVRIQPVRATSHEKLGRALLATKDTAEGITELEAAARLEPKDPKTHYELGRALRQAGLTERAQEEFGLSQKLYSAHSQE